MFDSSAQYEGISVNNVLLKGPGLNNDLLGILISFRREKIAVTADIQHLLLCSQGGAQRLPEVSVVPRQQLGQ